MIPTYIGMALAEAADANTITPAQTMDILQAAIFLLLASSPLSVIKLLLYN